MEYVSRAAKTGPDIKPVIFITPKLAPRLYCDPIFGIFGARTQALGFINLGCSSESVQIKGVATSITIQSIPCSERWLKFFAERLTDPYQVYCPRSTPWVYSREQEIPPLLYRFGQVALVLSKLPALFPDDTCPKSGKGIPLELVKALGDYVQLPTVADFLNSRYHINSI